MKNLLKRSLYESLNLTKEFVRKFEKEIKEIENNLKNGKDIVLGDIEKLLEYYLMNEDVRVLKYRDDALLNNVWTDYQKHGTIEFRSYVPLLLDEEGKIGFEILPFQNKIRDENPSNRKAEMGLNGIFLCIRGNLYRDESITDFKMYLVEVGDVRKYDIGYPRSIRELSSKLDEIEKDYK